MSKNTSSEMKLTPPAAGALSGLKGMNLQVFVMIAAIVAIMLFFTWTTEGAYLQPAASDRYHRHSRGRHGICDYFRRDRPLRGLNDGPARRRGGNL